MSNKLSFARGQSYLGTNADQPPNWQFADRDPDYSDINYSLGDVWLNTLTEDKWVLVSLENPGGPGFPKGAYAKWVPWGGTGMGILTITGTNAVAVPGDANQNINLATTIPNFTIDGNIVTNTLTFATVGGGGITTALTGDLGGRVNADGTGNINVVSGSVGLQTVGNLAANTLTIRLTGTGPGTIVQTLSGNANVAVSPAANGNIQLFSSLNGVLFNEHPLTNQISLDGVLGVPSGGTGNTAFTPFTVIVAGQPTGVEPFTNVAGVGVAGDVLTSNGPAMYPTWQPIGVNPAAQCSFLGILAADYNACTGNGTVVRLGSGVPLTVFLNITPVIGTGLATTGIFTCPIAGWYWLNCNIWYEPHSGGGTHHTMFLVLNGGIARYGNTLPSINQVPGMYGKNNWLNQQFGQLFPLAVNDQVWFTFQGDGGAKKDDIQQAGTTSFGGWLVYPT